MSLDYAGRPSARAILDRIRGESRDEAEKERWFEQLFMRVALQEPEFEIDGIWRWPEWPEREALTGLDGRDIGIDLVARRTSGEWITIQCKYYDGGHVLGKGGIDKFLGGSQQVIFRLRWIVATCRWGPNAERAIQNANPEIKQIDFRQLSLPLTPSGAETLVFWASQPLAWLVAPKDVPLMTRCGDLKLSHGATAKAQENAMKQDRVRTTNAIKSP